MKMRFHSSVIHFEIITQPLLFLFQFRHARLLIFTLYLRAVYQASDSYTDFSYFVHSLPLNLKIHL